MFTPASGGLTLRFGPFQETLTYLHRGIILGPFFLRWVTTASPGHQQCQLAVAIVH